MSLLQLQGCAPAAELPAQDLTLEGPRALWLQPDPRWLSLALGERAPHTGSIRIDGEDPRSTRPLSAAPAQRLPKAMRGRVWIAWCLRLQGMSRRDADAAARAQLQRFDLAPQGENRLQNASQLLRAALPLAAALACPEHARPIVVGDVCAALRDDEARWLMQRFATLASERRWLALLADGPAAAALAPYTSAPSAQPPAARRVAVIARGTPSAWQQLLRGTELSLSRLDAHAQGTAMWLTLQSPQHDALLFALAAQHGLSIIEWLPSPMPEAI